MEGRGKVGKKGRKKKKKERKEGGREGRKKGRNRERNKTQNKQTLGLMKGGVIRRYQCIHHATIYTIRLTIISAIFRHEQNSMATKKTS